MNRAHRCFFALRLDAAATAACVGMQTQLRASLPQARWVDAADLHITLKFLGVMTSEHRAAIAAATPPIVSAHSAPALTLGALDGFPSPYEATVLVAHVGHDGEGLAALVTDLVTLAQAHGVAVERRSFRAHVTLARFAAPTDVSAGPNAPLHARWIPDAVELLVSTGPTPPRFTTEHGWPLKPR